MMVVSFDVSSLIGEKIDFKIFDNATAGCGFVAFDHVYQTDQPRGTAAESGTGCDTLAPARGRFGHVGM